MNRIACNFQIIFWLVFSSYMVVGQSIDEQLDAYTSSFDTEKIYVHHDRPSYMQGDTIWCKVYLLDGNSQELIPKQTIVYVEWIDPSGELLETFNLRSDKGISEVDILIDPNTNTGEYTLKAYTLYQLNFDKGFLFQKKIKVTGFEDEVVKDTIKESFEVQFFPEGGYLVDGLESRIGFKAVDGRGKSIKINGKIITKQGDHVTTFKTLDAGLGFFYLTPQAHREYQAVVAFRGQQKTIELPDVLQSGYSMNISSASEDHIKIKLNANEKTNLNDCLIIGQQRGESFMNQPLREENGVVLSLDKEELPHGLLHFTLFDNKQRPIGERLVYNTKYAENTKIEISVDAEQMSSNRSIKATINSEEFSSHYKANLSLSIYNKRYIEGSPENGLNIKNYLNLQSELRGKINNINQYFQDEDAKSSALLDVLLMTHGWRKFTWQEVLSRSPKELGLPKESTFSLSGQVLKADKEEPVKANILVNILDNEDFSFSNLETGDDGIFHIDDLGIQDSTNVFVQASIYSEKKKKKQKKDELRKSGDSNVNVKLIELKEHEYDPTLGMPTDEIDNKIAEEKGVRIREVITTKLGLENMDSSLWSLSIDEVTVEGKKISPKNLRKRAAKREYRKRKIFYLGTTEKFFAEDLYKYTDEFVDVFDMISTAVAGTTARGPRGARKVMRKGKRNTMNTIPIALNGSLVSSHYLDFIDPKQVLLIEVISGAYASVLFGLPRVLRIVTKTDDPIREATFSKMTRGTLNIAYPGFYNAKEYYKKMYKDDVFTSGSDERVTLYWNPNIELNGDSYEVEFSTSNLSGEHIIVVEGITEDGIPIVANKTFYVENEEP